MTTLIQLYTGQNIQQSHAEPMMVTNVNTVMSHIKNGSAGLSELCLQLRTIARMDKAAYTRNKIRLPFFCCAAFEGNIRHSKNFRFAESFVLDFDHLESEQQIREHILPALKSDETIVMGFVSPSGKGIKILFALNAPIASLQDFSTFYKNFALTFSKKYGLEKNTDTTTSDATRICFLAHDAEVYFNENATPVNWHAFMPSLPVSNQHLFNQTAEVEQSSNGALPTEESNKASLPQATYDQVIMRLNPQKVTRQKVPLVVPEILDQVAVQIQAAIAGAGWQLKGITNIQYGKKIAAANGFVWAEVNVFYGKKGFSIVRSPKTGTDLAFGNNLETLIWETIQTPCEVDYGNYPDIEVV